MGNGAPIRGFRHCPGLIDMNVLVVVCQVRKRVDHLLAYRQPRGTTDFLPNFGFKFRDR